MHIIKTQDQHKVKNHCHEVFDQIQIAKSNELVVTVDLIIIFVWRLYYLLITAELVIIIEIVSVDIPQP